MRTLYRRLYRLLLRLHPAAFRSEFARDMALDFEDALATFGLARLFLDATRSLARQWSTQLISPSAACAQTTSRPLLAGHYMMLEGDPLTPFELFRGSLLFILLFFALGFALNHGRSRIHAGNLPGLPANRSAIFAKAGTGPFQPRATESSPGTLVRSADYAHPDPSARYILGAGNGTGEWGPDFFLLCAIISAIVWLTSFFVRRSRSVGVRVALVALGLITVVTAAAFVSVHAPHTYAQVFPGGFAPTGNPQAMRPQPARTPSFETVTIRPSNPAPGDSPTPASALAGTPGIESGDSIHITLPIRSLIASVCDMPAESQPCIIGGPAWLDSDTYDIQAKIDGTELAAMRQMSPAQQQYQIELMEQSLLVTRFHLKAHEETRILTASRPAPAQSPVEVLVIDSIDRPSEN